MHNVEGSTEAMAIALGQSQITAEELKTTIVGKTIRGLYRGGFRYNVFIGSSGRLEGVNHVGSHNVGVWFMGVEGDTFTVKWCTGWDDNTTRAYRFGDDIRFFDAKTGLWRTTFSGFEDGKRRLDDFD